MLFLASVLVEAEESTACLPAAATTKAPSLNWVLKLPVSPEMRLGGGGAQESALSSLCLDRGQEEHLLLAAAAPAFLL